MERLKTINSKLAELISSCNLNRLDEIIVSICKYSFNSANLNDNVFLSDAFNKIKDKLAFDGADSQKILALAEGFDENYYDMEESNPKEALIFFSKARATMAIYYSVKYILNKNRSEIKEVFMKHLWLKEDPEELFEILV